MRKGIVLLTAIFCLTLLSGCTKAEKEAEISSAINTVNETSVPEISKITTKIEGAVIEEVITEETVSEETDTPVTDNINDSLNDVITTKPETAAENIKVYKHDSEAAAEMPEFSMSLDELGRYDAETVLLNRTKIKAMLECSKSGEIPYVDYNGFEYELIRLENIKVESWSVIDEKYDNYRYEVTVTLDISESSVDEIPVGTADYVFIYSPGEDRIFLPLRKVGELDESRLLPYYGEGNEYLNFCNDFTAYFSDLYAGNEVTDFSSPDLSEYDYTSELVFNAMCTARRYYPDLDYDMSYEDFDTALKEIYGFSADSINTKETGYYDAESDTVSIPGRGMYWVCGYTADEKYDESSKTHTVTIDYYEDDFHLVKAQTYRYTVRENENGSYTMLKMERLFTSDRNILGGCV